MGKKVILAAVYFINQMPQAERGIVRRLVEDLEARRAAAETQIDIFEANIENKSELEKFFKEVTDDAAIHQDGHVIFHIDAHSDKTGIEVNGEMIPWKEFFTLLCPVNKAPHGRLSIHLAACRAVWSLKVIDINKSAPLYGLDCADDRYQRRRQYRDLPYVLRNCF